MYLRTRVNNSIENLVSTVTDRVLANAARHKKRFCLAWIMGRYSSKCTGTFKPGKRADHQCCSRACYAKLHRIPGFIRRTLRGHA